MTARSNRITILISGSGTNLEAIIKAVNDKTIPNTEIVKVISNRKNAYGLVRAQNANISTAYHNLVPFKARYSPDNVDVARSEYDKALASLVLADQPNLVVCAGFMHILSPSFLEPVAEKGIDVINLHPALPGQFDGVEAIERAQQAWLEGHIEATGVQIHYVIEKVDSGQPIVTKQIPFIKGVDEDLEKFKERVHKVEWITIVEGTRMALETLEQRREASRNE